MNKKQKQMLINHAIQKVRANSRGRKYMNCIHINPSNTYEHEHAKFNECWELSKRGIDFLTEAIFENGKRADIVAFDVEGEGVYCIEIMKSEEMSSIDNKRDKYPFPIVIVEV